MQISNVTRADLESALAAVNDRYAGNIRFKRIDPASATGKRWIVTLTANSSKAPGHRTSASCFHPRRRIAAACWHVHGHFFEALHIGAVIRTHWGSDKLAPRTVGIDYLWPDFNVGSIMYPMYMSDACDCED